jgi:hypothetical protein
MLLLAKTIRTRTGTARIADSIATLMRDLMSKRDISRAAAIEIISDPFSVEVRIRTRLRSDSHLRAFG